MSYVQIPVQCLHRATVKTLNWEVALACTEVIIQTRGLSNSKQLRAIEDPWAEWPVSSQKTPTSLRQPYPNS
jgi:hypothetical protein